MSTYIQQYFPEISQNQLSQFHEFTKLITSWNQKVNLISRTDMEHFELHHICHCLALSHCLPQEPQTIIDLGCGGGLPSIPLAIYFPQHQFIAVDSIQKKISVVTDMVKELNIDNVIPICSRVEDLKKLPDIHFIVSRAVAQLKNLIFWTSKILKPEHKNPLKGLICLKGGDLKNEIKDVGRSVNIISLHDFLKNDYFCNKYILY